MVVLEVRVPLNSLVILFYYLVTFSTFSLILPLTSSLSHTHTFAQISSLDPPGSMKFFIDDLPVLFPYPRIYPEQYAYMSDIKKTLDVGGNCILEMPSGTGKTISLLSLTVAYQMHYPEHRKIVYCSRTMSEIEKALIELHKLMEYRAEELGYVEDFRGLGLTSRKNLCIHPTISKERKGNVVSNRKSNWVLYPPTYKRTILRHTPSVITTKT